MCGHVAIVNHFESCFQSNRRVMKVRNGSDGEVAGVFVGGVYSGCMFLKIPLVISPSPAS